MDENETRIELKPDPLMIQFMEGGEPCEVWVKVYRGDPKLEECIDGTEMFLDEDLAEVGVGIKLPFAGLSSWEMDQVRLAISTEFMKRAAEYRARKLEAAS